MKIDLHYLKIHLFLLFKLNLWNKAHFSSYQSIFCQEPNEKLTQNLVKVLNKIHPSQIKLFSPMKIKFLFHFVPFSFIQYRSVSLMTNVGDGQALRPLNIVCPRLEDSLVSGRTKRVFFKASIKNLMRTKTKLQQT